MKEIFLSKNLNFLRTSNNLKQYEIQEKLGIKRNTWSNWENRKSDPSIEHIFQIADFFGVDVGSLLSRDLTSYNTQPLEHNYANRKVEMDGEPYQKKCTQCVQKEEIIDAQRITISALQGQAAALQKVVQQFQNSEDKKPPTL